MKVISCNFNNIFFELNIKLSKEEFSQSEDVIKKRLLYFSNDVLKKIWSK